ncbi:MAG TPA: cytochrome c oxidase subunit 3 [Candidatus Sulfotelmatobacter sp.]|nr:cytochrome c oxidase subunit 3 [Candidatus Sulfotelmatobacter sp.]
MSEANLVLDHVEEHGAGVMEQSPFAIPSSKLVMWLFIISDACTFGAILFAYGYIRNSAADWPLVFESASIWNSLLMTAILVSTSLTVLFALKAAQSNDRAGAFRWTMITAAGGVLFTLLHLREWMGLIHEGVRLFQNPWGAPMFGACFFSITGLHMAHVMGGVIALVVVGLGYRSGKYATRHVEIWSLYWHFVDLVWMFVVPLVYLLNMKR